MTQEYLLFGNNGVIECAMLWNNEIISMEAIDYNFNSSNDLDFDKLSNGFLDAVQEYVNPIYATDGRVFGSGNYGQGTFMGATEDSSYSLYVDEVGGWNIDYGSIPYELLGIGESYAVPLRSGSLVPVSTTYNSVYIEKNIQGIDESGSAIENFMNFSYIECVNYNYDEIYDVEQWEYQETKNSNLTIPIRPMFTLKNDIKVEKAEGEEIYRLVAP